ncbi:MAG: site-specific integrase [Bacteroidota bacterium]
MIEHFFTLPKVVRRKRFGPLGSYNDSYATLLSEQGYARNSARYRILLVEKLSKWLHRRQLGVKDLDEQITAEFLKYRRRSHSVRRGDAPALRLLLEHLRESGLIASPAPEIDDSELGSIERDFGQYLKHERRVGQLTLNNYLSLARHFLIDHFGKGRIVLNELCPKDVNKFILRYVRTASVTSAKLMVTALRTFFRYLQLRGEIAINLAAAVPTVPNWRFATVPKWIPSEQVERLLKSCDRSTKTGQRNYAILLLLARLGLRSADIVAMSLDDINWEAGELNVRGKGSHQDRLPLPHDVGEALVNYLHGRPHCSTRRVFVRMKAPLRGFLGSSAIYSLVRRAFDRAGLKPVQRGPCILRHSLATEMLRKGASLNEIGEILRHRHPETTQIYAKVDLNALRKLAEPWPGGAS